MINKHTFKDHFSKQAGVYSKYRPSYPAALFEYLHSLTAEHKLAWDCGTGNGQSAIPLATFYDQVYATDPSEQQIKNAIPHQRIAYHVEAAKQTSLADHSADLVTIAQALHWFQLDAFYKEVKRVLKPNGIIAAWAYGVPCIDDQLSPIIREFHDHVVGEFWLPENRMIDNAYSTIPFPFPEINPPSFFIRQKLDVDRLLGHIRSWSATQKYIDYQRNPLELLEPQLSKYWGKKEEQKEITWKLILKLGRV